MNPILQTIMGNNRGNQMMSLMNMMKSGNPNAIYNQMMQTNPQFRQFIEDNKDKTPEQIAQENGIDMNLLRQFM